MAPFVRVLPQALDWYRILTQAQRRDESLLQGSASLAAL